MVRLKNGSRQSVVLAFLIALMLVWTTGADGQADSQTPPTLAEISFYLDRIDTLEVDLSQCNELLVYERENPPECGGLSWAIVGLCVVSGLVVGVVVE